MASAPPRDAVPPIDERAHEAAVRSFLAGVPKRRRERSEAKHEVLDEVAARLIRQHESSWPGDVLDEVLVGHLHDPRGGWSGAAASRVGSVNRTPGALNLGHHRTTAEAVEESVVSGTARRPGDAAFYRPPAPAE